MNTRYESNIRNFIDEVVHRGYAKISKEMLVKCWYGQDRMSKTVWRDIVSKFPEDAKPEEYQIFEWSDDIILIEKECLSELSEML